MTVAGILRLVVVAEGMILLMMAFLSFVYRKMTEGIALSWGGFAAILILAGAVPAFVIVTAATLLGVFYLSCAVSQLIRKNQELAMHVSLLNQENESILEELQAIREREK